jgi:isopentenyl diphosphate isomerase/L-lactate dehydrogenase-like FMN-dependent dehydrogenase
MAAKGHHAGFAAPSASNDSIHANNCARSVYAQFMESYKTQLAHELRDIERAGFEALFFTVDNTGINGICTRAFRYTGDEADTGHSATFDLQSLATSRNMTKLPAVPNGIKSLGFAAIYISNHGGRALDGAPTAAEVLLGSARTLRTCLRKVEVYAHGGVRRGTDVIKLLALGVRAVGVGCP